MSKTPNAVISDLPLQPTALIGREREREAILAALAREDTRLVTLTGPGGIGKTRLALDVVANLADRYRDGVILVSLAPVRNPELVLPTIAQAVGVHESTGLSAREGIEAHLRGKRLLLLLDNLEHLLAAAPDIAWLLATCAGIDILATSQARLQIRGEHEFPVLPLPLPDTERPDSVSENPAVVLFTLRAGDVDPNFMLDSAALPVVAEICRRLDGIPLAIEMAAARVKVLPVSALLIRLDRRLPLLTSGARDLPDRLHTMRDAIAWSYDLLDADLQALFRQLCIFSGGFTLHEAETLIGTFDFEHDVVDNLARLVDTSFLRQVERDGDPRFQMLETLREFGGPTRCSPGGRALAILVVAIAFGRRAPMAGADARATRHR